MAKVSIKFVGSVAARANVDEMPLTVSADPDIAAREVNQAVIDKVGDNTLFSVVYNDRNFKLAIKNIKEIKDGDCFSIVPVILGG